MVRGLDDAVRQQLATQAKERSRSLEAEAREILTKAARRPRGTGGVFWGAATRGRYAA
ncbi:FitA-like ribbon-helix-helix domain-containing protein [Microbacterium halotolerans]|uniref:FitA-like ribbon-helix-helix domain-containing protein n=1 Tax=Microbacterium halotolerans TaxID=246613 RepID=UPI003B84AF1C